MLLEYCAIFQSINIARWSIVSQDAFFSLSDGIQKGKTKEELIEEISWWISLVFLWLYPLSSLLSVFDVNPFPSPS